MRQAEPERRSSEWLHRLFSTRARGWRTTTVTNMKWRENEQDVHTATANTLRARNRRQASCACCVLWPHSTTRDLHKESSAVRCFSRRLAQAGVTTETRRSPTHAKHRRRHSRYSCSNFVTRVAGDIILYAREQALTQPSCLSSSCPFSSFSSSCLPCSPKQSQTR